MLKRLWLISLLCHLGPVLAQAQDPVTQTIEKVDRASANPSTPVRKPGGRPLETPQKTLVDPRRWVFIAVVGFLVLGGGRKWLAGRRARDMADKLAALKATPDEIRASHKHGRIVVPELFRVMADGPSPDHRLAATQALVRLWKADELIPEEEKAILTRSLRVDWQIRRKYPRLLTGSLLIRASYGPPKLADDGLELWLMQHLRWSHRVTGTRRAADDAWQEPTPAPAPQALLQVIADDFPDDGPHRLLLHLKVKTLGLTDNWELDMPAQSTSFEWDDHLQPSALVTLPDSARASQWALALGFMIAPSADNQEPFLLPLTDQFALRNPPIPTLQLPYPSDLAHRVVLEFQGISALWLAGEWLEHTHSQPPLGLFPKPWPDHAIALEPQSTFPHAGHYRMRLILQPTPERGWSDPLIRSVWPDAILSEWVGVELVRR